MNKKQIDTIINDFQKYWTPQTISSAENLFSRFMAGETYYILWDEYQIGTFVLDSAIRLFILYRGKNKRVIAVYQDMQNQRFEVKA